MKIFEKILGSNILYYPGCLTKFVAKELLENYRKILEKIGVDFIELKELEVCCGSPVLKAGYFDDFKNLAKKNLKVFKDHSVKKIITNCPACALTFKKEYPKVLGDKWDIEVEHIAETLAKSNSIRNLKFKDSQGEPVTYHDPCHLGRLLGIYEEPREIIKKAGFQIKEMELTREESFCCGGGGGVQSNEPEIANQIAKSRIEQAKKTGARVLYTACPLCYLHLKNNAKNLEIKELSQLFKL